MTRIRRLALAAAMACLVAGKAWAHRTIPIPLMEGGLLFNCVFLLGVIAAGYGIFRLTDRIAGWWIRRGRAGKPDFSQDGYRRRNRAETLIFIGTSCLWCVLMIPAVIAAYIASLFALIILDRIFH